MKKIKKIILLIFALISITGCYKLKSFKKIKVNVKVINPITGVGYSNVKWEILESKKDLKVLSSNSHVFMDGLTDENGEAHIEFKKPMGNKWGYSIRLVGVDSYPYSWSLDNDKVYDITAYKSEQVNFVLHIKNTNCFDADDKALLSLIQGKYYKKKIFYEESIKLGCYDYTTPYNIEMIEDIYPYTIEITRNGQTTTIEDSFTVTKAMEGDTINIFY